MTVSPTPYLSADAMRGHLAMLAFSALVAGSFALGGLAAPLIDPLAFNAARFWVGAAAILAVLLLTGEARAANFAQPWRFLILGGLFAVYFGTMFKGLQTATPVSTAAVFTLTPVMSAGFAWVLLRQVVTPRMALALAIAAAGAVWVIFGASWEKLSAFRIGEGEAIFFIGCIAHALYIPLVRVLKRAEPLIVLTFGTLVAGGVLLTLLGYGAIRATAWDSLPGIVWVAILYTAIMASAVTFFLIQYAALTLPSAKVLAYTYLVPAWVICWEYALGAGLPPVELASGIGLVVVGLVLLLKD